MGMIWKRSNREKISMQSGRKENQRKAGMEYYTEKYFEEEQKNRGGLAKWQQGYYAVENILLDYRWLSDKIMIN